MLNLTVRFHLFGLYWRENKLFSSVVSDNWVRDLQLEPFTIRGPRVGSLDLKYLSEGRWSLDLVCGLGYDPCLVCVSRSFFLSGVCGL